MQAEIMVAVTVAPLAIGLVTWACCAVQDWRWRRSSEGVAHAQWRAERAARRLGGA